MEIGQRHTAKKRAYVCLIGLCVTIMTVGLFYFGLFEQLELLSYDLRFSLRAPITPHHRITLIGIDEYDRNVFQKNIKDIDRAVFGQVVRNLCEDDAYVIAFDLDFSMPTDPDKDRDFAQAIAESQRVVLGRSLNKPPLELFRAAIIAEGVYDLQLDQDGVLRAIHLNQQGLTEQGELVLLSPLGLKLAELFLFPTEAPEVHITAHQIHLNDYIIPQKMLVNFAGPPGSYSQVHFSDVYRQLYKKGTFTGKTVIIGNTDPLAHDYFAVPLTPRETGAIRDIHRMSGLEIHANILATILDRSFIQRFDGRTIVWSLLVYGLVFSLLFSVLGNRTLLFIVLFCVLSSTIVFSSVLCFNQHSIWLDTVPFLILTVVVFIAAALTHWRLDSRERRIILNLFGKYVSPQVANMLVEKPDLISLKGKKAVLTVFFSDIRGFTSMSESMDPQQVSELLNDYFARMTKILFKYDGTLDKFMGDAIMAFFGNPNPYQDHALRAISMSLEMIAEVRAMNQRFTQMGKKTFDIGIGINTGEVTVGNLGSPSYFDYTVIGDNVNLACRLESIAKAGQIIISDKTFAQVEDQIISKKLEPVLVKGKEKPVQIYEVIALKNGTDVTSKAVSEHDSTSGEQLVS